MNMEGACKVLGINYLTGERDATGSCRVLYDISEAVVEDLRQYFSFATFTLEQGWNNSSGYSLMMHPSAMSEFIIFCMRRRGYSYINLSDCGGYHSAVFTDETTAKEYREHFPSAIVQPPISGSVNNVHQMSGRS